MTKTLLITLLFLFSLNTLAAPRWISLDPAERMGGEPTFDILESNGSGMKVLVRLPGVYMDTESINGEKYDTIRIPNAEPSLKVGNPDVQSLGYLLQVVEGSGFDIKVISSRKRIIDDINLMPVKKYPTRCGNGTPTFMINKDVYSTNTDYPGKVVNISGIKSLRNILVGTLSVNPVQYNPIKKELSLFSSVEVRISYAGFKAKSLGNIKESRAFNEIMAKQIVNFRESNDREVANEVMLLIAADEFLTNPKSLLPDYIESKKMLGIDVAVKKVSEIGNNKEAIKAFIQGAYDNWTVAPAYLLLIGNEHTLETYKKPTSAGLAASDYVYSLLEGNDILPDLLYGRIVADDIAGANTQLNKIMKYEWEPLMQAGIYNKALGIASNEGSNPSDEDYINQVAEALTNHSYIHFDKFFQKTGNATESNINAALNAGRSWLTYLGHGSGKSWGSTNGSYSNASISKLANGYKTPVIVDVACLNAQYDKNYECFGEKWMRAGSVEEPKGAVGYWGGSVSISWHPPAIMARGIAKKHFEKPIHTLGGSLLAGQLYLVEQSGTGTGVEDNFEWYNLFGDPSMLMRTDNPKEFTFKGDEFIGIGIGNYVGSLKGGADALVTLFNEETGEIISRTIADGGGNFKLSFAPMVQAGKVLLTANKYNFSPMIAEIEVIPLSGAFIAYKGIKIDSESEINDGKPNPSEDLSYSLIVDNIGKDASDEVVIKVRTNSPYVLSYVKSLHISAIAPESTAEIKGFDFSLKKNIPNNTEIAFEFNWETGEQSGKFTKNFTVAAAEVVFTSAKLVSDQNGNGFVDPGESIEIELKAKNIGQIPSGTGYMRLLTESLDIELVEDALNYNQIGIGEETAVRLKLDVLNSAVIGSIISFDVISDLGVEYKSVLGIAVGTPKTVLIEYNGEPVKILDKATVESKVNVPEGIVKGIRVRLDISHTYQGDLVITLQSPKGEQVTLRKRKGGSADNLHIWIPGDEKPFEDLNKLFNQYEAGEWKLLVEDVANGDRGTIDSWKLEFYGYFK